MKWKIYLNFMKKQKYMIEIMNRYEVVYIFYDEDCKINDKHME